MANAYRKIAIFTFLFCLALGPLTAKADTANRPVALTTTIASGQSLSGSVDLNVTTDSNGGSLGFDRRLFGIIIPSSFTGTSISFQASSDNGVTWNNIYDALGSEYYITVAASRYIPVDPTPFSAVSMIRVRSGTAASPTTEAADRSIKLIVRAY